MSGRARVESVLRLTRASLCEAGERGLVRAFPDDRGFRRRTGTSPSSLALPESGGAFHFTHRLWLLCADVAERMSDFSHIDMRRVLVTYVRCRNDRAWGLQAKLVPLRFRGGRRTQVRRGHLYKVQQLYVEDVELEYVLSFYMPRFANQSFDEKMITIFHELYHICPETAGDIRRFDGANPIHDRSQRDYDRRMARFARRYLESGPNPILVDFLRLSHSELLERYGEVVGVNIPSPKLIPVTNKSRERTG